MIVIRVCSRRWEHDEDPWTAAVSTKRNALNPLASQLDSKDYVMIMTRIKHLLAHDVRRIKHLLALKIVLKHSRWPNPNPDVKSHTEQSGRGREEEVWTIGKTPNILTQSHPNLAITGSRASRDFYSWNRSVPSEELRPGTTWLHWRKPEEQMWGISKKKTWQLWCYCQKSVWCAMWCVPNCRKEGELRWRIPFVHRRFKTGHSSSQAGGEN